MADPKLARPSLRLDTLTSALGEKLENEAGVLDLLIAALARGQGNEALWDQLHEAALRDDKLAELAFTYERASRDARKMKSLTPAMQAAFLLHAGTFFAEVFGDTDGAEAYLERAAQLTPNDMVAFQKLEAILEGKGDLKKLGELYAAAAPHRGRGEQIALLRKAADLLARDGDHERAIKVALEILRLEPGDAAARAELEALYERAGKVADLARLLEQALVNDPPPAEESARSIRLRLLSLYAGGLAEIERALPHVEEILRVLPAHPAARKVAEQLLGHKALTARVAAALASACEREGDLGGAARMLAIEIETLRGPKRLEAQKRLATLAYERLGDRDKTFALDEAIVPLDPGDHAVRARYVALAAELGRQLDATKVLARAAAASKDPAVRARIGADLGDAYLGLGDARRARMTYQGVLDARADDEAMLRSARALAAICEAARDVRALAAALARLAELEPEEDARVSATARLAALAEGELGDTGAAIAAQRRLLGTRLEAEALEALARLYEATGAHEDLANVLGARAAIARDTEQARALAFRAAEIRSGRLQDRAAALAAWRAFVATYGPSREALARLVPLLENERRWDELAGALASEAALTPEGERAAVLARLGQLLLARLGDARASLEAHRQALALDPTERQSRLAVDRMLSAGELRLEAADVLEPIARAEGSATALVRVLEARAALAGDAEGRLAAIEEASELAQRALKDPRRAVELAARGLAEALAGAIDRTAAWIERIERLTAGAGDAARRAAALREALGERAVDGEALALLARRAGEALVASGDVAGALDALRRALAFDPSSAELLDRVDTLLREQGSPEERLALHRAALDRPCDPARRRELLHTIAAIERRDLGSASAATATYRRALAEDPGDRVAFDALLELYEAAGEWEALYAELEGARAAAPIDERGAFVRRMAEVAAARGWLDRAAAHYAALIADDAIAADEVLAAAEQVARARGDAALLRATLERRVATAVEPHDEATWLERLGELDAGADPERAAAVWRRAAAAAARAGDAARAEGLYERALAAVPDDRAAAAKLVDLYRERGAWERAPGAYAVLLRTAESADEAVRVLLAFEAPAALAGEGARARFVEEADAILARGDELGREARAAARAARARTLAKDPARQDEAAAAYRAILAEGDGDVEDAARAFEASLSARGGAAAADRRWLFAWRTEQAPEGERIPLLLAWAVAEETDLGDTKAAGELYARVIAIDPDHDEALAARARLLFTRGDLEGAALAIAERRSRREGSAGAALDLELATLLLDRLGRPLEALDAVASVLDATPADPAALALAERALARPEARARAAELLERGADAADDPAAATALLEVLLSTPADAPELRDSRRGWFERLLDQPGIAADRALSIAVRAASELPADLAFWERAEELARASQAPARVAEAYRRALGVVAASRSGPASIGPASIGPVSSGPATVRMPHAGRIDVAPATLSGFDPEQIEEVGRRAVEYHEEWFDDQETVVAMLRRLVELVPGSSWAFERLKLLYNLAERWDDLFALYDEAVARAPDALVRRELLEDAALAAKDLAGDSARAMGYLEALHALRPDPKTRATLERLYERHGRHRPLIDLLAAELVELDGEAAQRARARIAALWLDGVGDADAATRVVDDLLDAAGDEGGPWRAEALDLLERVIDRTARAPEAIGARQRAAARLKDRYLAEGRAHDLVRVLEIDLDAAKTTAERAERLAAIVRLRLGELGDEAGAFERLAELVALDPAAEEHREELGRLAARLGQWARFGEVLAAAAARAEPALGVELYARAAEILESRLDDAARAIDLNRSILALAGDRDPAALAAARRLDRLLDAAGRAPERCDVLARLAAMEPEPAAQRAALAALARLARAEVGDLDRAIRTLRAMLDADPGDLEAERDLCRALEEAGHWGELIEALKQRADREGEGARADRARVARLLEERLDRPDEAIAAWTALRARHGADDESADALASLFERTGQWEALADLLDTEAAATSDPGRTADLLARIGDLHRERTLDLEGAVAAYDLALEARPGDPAARRGLEALVATIDPASLEARPALASAVASLIRLYASTDAFARTIALCELRLATASTDAERVAILTETARLEEHRAGDAEGAFEATWRAFSLSPGDALAAEAMRLADAADQWGFIADALARGAPGPGAPAPIARELWWRVAAWHRDQRGDAAAAEGALTRALALDPGSAPILEALADVQRRAPGRALITTLLELADAAPGDLDRYREAVEVAEGPVADAALAKTLAERLLDAAAERWSRSPDDPAAAGPSSPSRAAAWALDALVRLVHDEGPARVADLYLRGARLPFDAGERRRLRLRAAELSDEGATLAIYRELFDEDPADAIVGERLDALYRGLGLLAERIAVRERQIAAAPEGPERALLRFDLAGLLVDGGDAARAISVLRENLSITPLHAPSAARLAELLEAGGLHAELATLCEDRAAEAEISGDRDGARALWAKAAALAEAQLADAGRAIAAHRRAAALGDPASADALARLLLARGEHAAAAEVLESICERAAPAALATLALRLADAYLAAGQPAAARARLEHLAPRADDAAPIRDRLAALYREAGEWGALAALIADDAARAPDRAARSARLREAADLHLRRRRDPAAAIPLLEQAAELTPDDLSVRLELASAKTAAGRLDEAAASLRAAIATYGTRRPKERAVVHFELAKVSLASGDRARALGELDLAIRIDPGHPAVLHALARLAFEEGQLERATRMYRALLLVVRKPRAGGASPVSRAEALFELSELTRLQGEPERAAEYLESAFDAAREGDEERDRLLDALRARGRHELLAQALEKRLAEGASGRDAAAILEELASLYEAHLGRLNDALGARLTALGHAPATPAALDAALDLARRSGAIERFVATLSGLAAADPDPVRAIDLTLTLARVLERDAGDDARAAEAYRSAEEHLAARGDEGRLAEVWSAEGRVYERLGNVDAEEALLERTRAHFEGRGASAAPAERADPLYRQARLRLLRRDHPGDALALIERALAIDPDPDRAESILRDALARAAARPPVAPALEARPIAIALERFARETGRDRALVDALVAIADLDFEASDAAPTSLGVGRLEGLREAAAVARRLDDSALVQRILRKALERVPIVGDAVLAWAFVALAAERAAEGDLAEAADLRERAARASPPEEERPLLLEVARLAAGALADLPRAARLYEGLYAIDPAEREIWQPLADVYRRQGDRARLAALLEQTAPLVDSAAERARLHLERAKMAIIDDEAAAIPLLEEVLEENPSEVEAAMLLSDILARLGRSEELAAVIARQLDAAKDRQDVPTIVSLTLRLGPLLEQQGDEQGALDAYHAALDWDAESRDVLRNILRLATARDDSMALGDVMDRLLVVEVGEAAADLARKLAAIRTARGDARGALNALEAGFSASPGDAQIRDELIARLTAAEAWRDLAALHARDAEARATREERVACLSAAAFVLRERAGDAYAAAEILHRALAVDPNDREVLLALIDALCAVGEHEGAIAAISRALEATPDDPWLYRSRASLHDAIGRDAAALADLEYAYDRSGGGYASELVMLLERAAAQAARDPSLDARAVERGVRLRLAEVLARCGEGDRARAHLTDLTRTDGKDRAALRALAELEVSELRWDAATSVYRRLLVLQDGDALVDTALRLADACERADRLADARGALERALRVAPAHAVVRERLREVYNVTGAARELAGLIIEDAAVAPDVQGRFALLLTAGRLLLDSDGEAARAASVLEEARGLRPEEPETTLLLADAYTASGRLPDARALLEAAAQALRGRRSKQLGAIHRRLARIDLAYGDREASLASLTRAFDNDPQNAALAMELGLFATELDEHETATRAFRAVTLMKDARTGSIPPPAHGEPAAPVPRALAYYHLGRMAFAQGDRKKARLMVEKAVAEDPSLDAARALLDHLRVP